MAKAREFEHFVADGMLIANSAVRMAVKNAIIIAALREHDDFDPAAVRHFAGSELRRLAVENEADARRVRKQRKRIAKRRWAAEFTVDDERELERLKLRRRIHESLAARLVELADDEAALDALIGDARDAASAELADAVRSRLLRLAIDADDPLYARERDARLRSLVTVDLAELELRQLPEY